MRKDIRRSRFTSSLSMSTQFGYAPQPAISAAFGLGGSKNGAYRRAIHRKPPRQSASWTTRSMAKPIFRPWPRRWFSRWKVTTPSAVVVRSTSSRASSGDKIRLTPLSVFASNTLASGSDIPCPYSQAAARIGCGSSGSGQASLYRHGAPPDLGFGGSPGSGQASSDRHGVQNRPVGEKRHVRRVEMGVVHGGPSPRISTSQRMLPSPGRMRSVSSHRRWVFL